MSDPIRIYLAAPWAERPKAIAAGEVLAKAGFTVTSRWFHHDGDPADSTGASVELAKIQQQAYEDFEDILDADVVVVLNLAKSEGKAVETGFALAHGIPVISVGTRSNIFQSLGTEVATLDTAIAILNNFLGGDLE